VAALRLKLAKLYREKGDYDRAVKDYKAAIYLGVPEIADQARGELEALRTWLADRPHKTEDFAALLEKDGFVGPFWSEETPPNARQVVRDNVLELTAAPSPEGVSAYRESIRPVKNFGFEARVEFRAADELLRRPGGRLGLAVLGVKGDSFEIDFDGRGYSIGMTRNPTRINVESQVAKAAGDETSRWHELGLRYNYQTGEMRATLDGREVCRYAMDLSDFRLRIFTRSSAESPARGFFRNVRCGPLSGEGRTA
jgi:hypothetical protein